MPDAFFEPAGAGEGGAERFDATEATRGPWDPDAQHAGPPTALIGRAVERFDGAERMHVARITFEILRPIPIAPVEVGCRVARPGRRVDLIEARLRAGGEEIIRAHAWRFQTAEVALPDGLPNEPAPPGPEQGEHREFPDTGYEVGYARATEQRFIEGAYREPGPAVVWFRMRHPLVSGEQPSPLTRVLIAADSGNGVSATLDWRRYLFINTELSVHLVRPPEGDWVCLDAITYPEPNGVGLSDTALYDERGRIGRAAQALVVGER